MKKKLGEILVEQGSVTSEDVQAVLDAQANGDPMRLGDLLLQWSKVTPEQLARALCAQSGLPYVHLEQVSPDVAALVSMDVQMEYGLVPFKQDGPGGAVHVAVSDPTTKDVLAEIELKVGRSLKISIAARDEIESVHRALQGDVLEAEVVTAEPVPPPAPAPPPPKQALGRLALKRVAVVAGGAVERSELGASPIASTGKVPAFAAEVPELELPSAKPVRPRPSAPPASSYHPTVEVALPPVAAAAPSAPAAKPSGAAGSLPPRASRSAGRVPGQAVPPPMLTPVDAKPKAKPTTGKHEPVKADEWSVRPVAAAFSKSGPRAAVAPQAAPAAALDPFATLPTEEVGPRDYVPPAITPGKKPPAPHAPLSALDADPELHERLKDPDDVPLGREPVMATRVEFYVAPPPPLLSPSGEAAPVRSPREKQVETDAAFPSLPEPPLPAEPADLSGFEPLDTVAPTIMADAISAPRPKQMETLDAAAPVPMASPAPNVSLGLEKPVATKPQYTVPSGRDRPVETQLQFEPPESARAKVKTDPEASPAGGPAPIADWKKSTQPNYKKPEAMELDALALELPPPEEPDAPDDEISIDGDGEEAVEAPSPREAHVPTQPATKLEPLEVDPHTLGKRTESLEFIPPAESAPRPGKPPMSAYVPPPPRPLDELAPPPVAPLPDLESGPTTIDIARVDPPPPPVPLPTASRPRPIPPPAASSRSATPPGGVPVVAPKPSIDETESATPPEGNRKVAVPPPVERPPVDTTSSATPPEGNRALSPEVIAAVSPPPEPVPSVEPPPPEPAAPEPAAAEPSLELPAWMRETANEMPALPPADAGDTLTTAVTEAGAPAAVARLLKLLVKRGVLTEDEVLEELKKK